MSINMADVKQIINNANNKEVVKIEDSIGNILWQKPSSITYPYLFMSNASYCYTKDVDVEWTWANSSSYRASILPVGQQGQYVWVDNNKLYCSTNGAHFRYKNGLDNFNLTPTTTSDNWEQLADTTDVWGNSVLKVNGTIYGFAWAGTNKVYKWNSSTETWTDDTSNWNFSNISSTHINGDLLWTDGTDIYCQLSNRNISVLNQSTLTFGAAQDTGGYTTTTNSYMYWTDGTDIYYSNGSAHRVWNKTTKQWSNKTWSGLTNFGGNEVFFYNGEIYVRQAASPYAIYKLNTSTSTWTQTYTNPMGSSSNFRGARMWDLGGRSTANTIPWLQNFRRANK